MLQLPDKFVQKIKGVHHDKGAGWLEQLPELIQYCEKRWSFTVLSPYELSFNYVAPVRCSDGSEAVLKLGVPSSEIVTETEALRLYKGIASARLWDADTDKGILIIERANPGHTLKAIADDDAATLIAASVIKRLHVPPPMLSLFPSTEQWAKGLDRLRMSYNGGTGPLPESMVRQAEEWFVKLHATLRNPRLLHGDLHHENILSAEREPYLAIDPKGVIGELEFELFPYLVNHLPDEGQMELIRRRVELLCLELGLNKERVLAWCYSRAVLSAYWNLEDQSDDVDRTLGLALIFEKLLQDTH